MIKGEKDFVRAIKDVKAKGALQAELVSLLIKQYKHDRPPSCFTKPEHEDSSMKDTKTFTIDPASMKGAEDQFGGSDFEPIATAEQEALINQVYSSYPVLNNKVTATKIMSIGRPYTTGLGLGDGFDKDEPWLQTYSGRRFNPTKPNPEAIVLQDIAHALSMLCRFNGHCHHFYSVAQHSVLVSHICNGEDALWGLLHDASEAYLTDLPRPLKRSGKMDSYIEFEHQMQKAVCKRFGLPEKEPYNVKRADTILLATEARDLMSPRHPDWIQPTNPLPFKIEPWDPKQAEWEFLERFKQVTGCLNP